jgi:hypothetical protein
VMTILLQGQVINLLLTQQNCHPDRSSVGA